MGENRKKVDAILRKVAKKAELAKAQAVTCPACKTRIESWWNFCAQCGWAITSSAGWALPSYADPPFACPPDGEGA